ncbi:MAG: HAMP domain-containing sensor histidine kinase [bacterium]|nr:HAMP domain-containing sensor histidine kinase [bacterium]
MKLLTKTSIYYLIFSLILFLIGGIFFYMQLRTILDEEFTEDLYKKKEHVEKYVNDSAKIPVSSDFIGDKITVVKADQKSTEQLKDTVIFDPVEKEYLQYRQLIFQLQIDNDLYSITVSKPLFESEDLIDGIITWFVITSIIMLVLLFFLTRLLSKKMWTPFYNTLDHLQGFDLSNNKSVDLSPVSTLEFKMMNDEIMKMTDKVQRDYQSLKEFTENASHEIQTPLSIIRSKIEVMIQAENLMPDQLSSLKDIYESTHRLSKLNQSLLLLAKIENRQFPETNIIDLKELLEIKLNQYDEMIGYKNISVERNFNNSPALKMNSYLADILFSNILINAIKHSSSSGKLIVELNNNSVIITNSGTSTEIPSEKLFQRFQKGDLSGDSHGLGLSIVKQICMTYGLKIEYLYKDGNHIVSVNF